MSEKHPAAGLTKTQREAFDLIAAGDDGQLSPRTTDSLVRRGLVIRRDVRIGYPPMTVHRFEVPLDVHYQWCRWCAENVEDPQ